VAGLTPEQRLCRLERAVAQLGEATRIHPNKLRSHGRADLAEIIDEYQSAKRPGRPQVIAPQKVLRKDASRGKRRGGRPRSTLPPLEPEDTE
jgi:hypothetical protein